MTLSSEPDEFDKMVDASTEYVVVPNRGLLFQRTGTIFSHPQMNLMMAVITLEPLRYEQTPENRICREALWAIERKFNATMDKYHNITQAIFQSKNIFTTEEICEIFDDQNNHPSVCPNFSAANHKEKRFASVGAYALAGTAMAAAVAAVGVSTSNKIELDKVKKILNEQEDSIKELQDQLKHTNNKLEVVLDTQRSVLGYIEQMSSRVDVLNSKVDCMHKHFSYLHWSLELQAEVENLLQFVFKGNLQGKLTPTLIRPALLRKLIRQQSFVNSKILGRYPNMLYSSATASLLNADFKSLQFTYLISFPDFGNDPIYPYLTVQQNGFFAKHPSSNESTCLMFNMPQTAIIHDGKLHALKDTLTCSDFGNVQICDSKQLDMIPMADCLNLGNNFTTTSKRAVFSYCQLTQCIGNLRNNDVYISSPSRLLVRTLSPTIEIVYDQPKHQLDLYVSALMKAVATPESGAMFIPWHKNISAVTFSKAVVYSPINANHKV